MNELKDIEVSFHLMPTVELRQAIRIGLFALSLVLFGVTFAAAFA